MARHTGIAYVLHRRAYRESSLLLELLCEEQGRIGLVARGRGAGHRESSALQPFTRLRLGWSGRGELGTLGRFEPAGVIRLRRGGLPFGLYLNELVQRSVPRSASVPEVFRLYEDTLRGLARTDDPWAVMLGFQTDFLRVLGYELQLEATADQGLAIEADRMYRYHGDAGPMSDVAGGGIPVSGKALLALRSRLLEDRDARVEAVALMDALFDGMLGGSRLNARRLLPPV
jgi:DNA repair protein RecO (recombination protein O)